MPGVVRLLFGVVWRHTCVEGWRHRHTRLVGGRRGVVATLSWRAPGGCSHHRLAPVPAPVENEKFREMGREGRREGR